MKLVRPIDAVYPMTERYNVFHKYMVFDCPVGTYVKAAEAGVVLKSHDDPNHMLGKHMIVINHKKDIKLIFAYLDSIIFNTGCPIAKGEVIALSGQTGSCREPCLYFQAKISSSEEPFEPELISEQGDTNGTV